jgi:hypothetical protein
MNVDDIRDLVELIDYKDWRFHVGEDRGHVWLQVRFSAADTVAGTIQTHHGRKWLLSRHMTKSEVVLTAFKAVLTAEEHEVRESFRYMEKAIFNPHIDVDVLVDNCDRVDARTAGQVN